MLDFGLAKAFAGDQDACGSLPIWPTRPPSPRQPMTQMGVILGTAAYMAPEQTRGKRVDRRADIWAFGCVLYEMLSGLRPFGGSDVTDTLAAVVSDTPDWGRLPAGLPSVVRTLIERCLDKDPRERLRDIGEARIALTRAAASSLTTGTERRRRWPISLDGRWLVCWRVRAPHVGRRLATLTPGRLPFPCAS